MVAENILCLCFGQLQSLAFWTVFGDFKIAFFHHVSWADQQQIVEQTSFKS